jgi:serine phosphatase RsbU (regulator of sigma subunit)
MRRYAGDGPDVLVEHIMDLVRHFRGPQAKADDATLLALMVE